MDARILEPQTPPKKRPQKYMGFSLVPGDEELLNQLPQHQREILRAQGDYAQIAAQLGVPMGTVRSRLHRARAALSRLRQQTQDEFSHLGNTDLH